MIKDLCNNKIFILLFMATFIIFFGKVLKHPNITLNTIFLVLTLSYFFWRSLALQRKTLWCFILLLTVSYWISEAYWRIDERVLYYYHFSVDVPIRYVSYQKAFIGALGYFIVSFALIFDMIFGKIKKKISFINIEFIKRDDYKWHSELKQRAKNREKLIAYSKDGANAAKKKAIELGLKDCFVDFKSKEEVEKERGW